MKPLRKSSIMLRRLSDVTITSIEKIFGGKEEKTVVSEEKKRRFTADEADKENCVDWEVIDRFEICLYFFFIP